jgi:ABC-2 type transport system permease protein
MPLKSVERLPMTSATPGLAAPAAGPSAPSALAEITQETLALTGRLFVQLRRRPSTLVAGVLQPLIWLLLFGALFAKAPEGLLPGGSSYGRFLGAGVIVFTAFSGALNAGLPVMFDREFGFLNRLLVAPLRSRSSIVLASVLYITVMSLVQSVAIMAAAAALGYGWPGLAGLGLVLVTLLLLVFATTALSLGLAFALPGHIELIAVIFVANLPLLFASTALAPIAFMPTWLGWLAALNPLTLAIEPIRAAYGGTLQLSQVVLDAPYGQLSAGACLMILAVLAVGLFLAIRPLLNRKLA